MADPLEPTQSSVSAANYRVTWGVQTPSVFQEVSGLQQDTGTIEQRRSAAGGGLPIAVITGSVVLRRGIVAAEDRLWSWYRSAMADAVVRSVVLIDLLDENGTPLVTWMMKNAWPTKLIAAGNSSSGPVAVEAVVFAFDSIEVTG